jgi:hypothetical protein
MGKSTVSTVAELIANTKEAQELYRSFEAVMRGPKVIQYSYFTPYDSTEPACRATVHSVATPDIIFGAVTSKDMANYQYHSFYFQCDKFINENSMKPIMDMTFGIHVTGRKKAIVPTYGLTDKKKPDILKAATSQAVDRFREMYSAQIVNEASDLTKEIRAYFASPECAAGIADFRVEEIVKQLKRVLVRYKNTDPDIIRRASEEAIVSLVMES